jgi:hypothetical protein
MAARTGFTLIVVCPSCSTKNRAYYHLLRKTNCAKCKTALLQPDKPQGYVYLLRSGLYYKIGKAVDLKKRLNQIKLHLPFEVELVHAIEAFHPYEVEKHWHRHFADKRTNGEWFVLTDAEVAQFKSATRM